MPKTVLFATFALWLKGKRTPINGMIEPMLWFFGKHNVSIDLIEGLHPGSSDVMTLMGAKRSVVSFILKPLLLLSNTNTTQVFFKIRDFLSVFEWIITTHRRYDLFIGLESIYTLSGIILKKLGIVQKVVYYVSDYAPARYGDTVFNSIYLALDRLCCYHSDYIWDVSLAFHPARISRGLDASRSAPVVHVPNALFPQQIYPVKKRKENTIVFAGTLNIYNGPDVAVEMLPAVRKKIPDATLHVYGTNGADQARVLSRINDLHLEQAVIFHGLITDAIALSREISKYSIGVAPYIQRENSHRAFGDATKLRLYAGAGLPIITTHVPPLGRELSRYGAAILTTDDPIHIARRCIELLGNSSRLSKMRSRGIAYARSNTWDKTYIHALQMMNFS